MILVVGGIGMGKRSFVKTLGYSDTDMSAAYTDGKPVLYDTQEILRRHERHDVFPSLLAKEVVICNEVGNGVVPFAEGERQWREKVGRLCCDLAKEANTVVRVCCGIPQVLKGSL